MSRMKGQHSPTSPPSAAGIRTVTLLRVRAKALLGRVLVHASRTAIFASLGAASLVFALILLSSLSGKTVHPSAQPQRLDLTVSRQNGELVVRWQKDESLLRTASHGILFVVDGFHQNQISLTRADLATGVARYKPESPNVSFRLTLYDGPPSSNGAVMFVARNEPVPASPPPKKLEPVQPTIIFREPPDEAPAPVRVIEPSRPSPPPETPPPPRPIPSEPEKIAAPQSPPPLAVPVKETPRPPRPAYRYKVTIEPAGPSKVGTAISKVPFLKRLRKTSSELPKPRHEASVGTVHEQLPGPLDVKVQVELTREGRVESANLIEEDLPTQGEFAWASLRAARSWTFQPASDGPNKAVLHFHFEPTER